MAKSYGPYNPGVDPTPTFERELRNYVWDRSKFWSGDRVKLVKHTNTKLVGKQGTIIGSHRILTHVMLLDEPFKDQENFTHRGLIVDFYQMELIERGEEYAQEAQNRS